MFDHHEIIGFFALARFLQSECRGGSHGDADSFGDRPRGYAPMENAQLITLSRQIALQRQMDVVANNMANINTNGFKSEGMLFEDYLMPKARDNDFGGTDDLLHYTEDWSTMNDMTNGPIEQTGNTTDVALEGKGFLSVQTPAGTRYTRNGSLEINAQGTLVDLDGNPVLGEGGPITFDSADTDITISRDGSISTSQGSKGKLAVVEFADPQSLMRQGDNYYSGTAGTPATDTSVVQGSIERSNVSGVTTMADMIRVQRNYETLANLMQQQDNLRNTAVQQLGNMTA
jgi:flagellar basal-body rod protein FlgF